jgi:hypothetical protein
MAVAPAVALGAPVALAPDAALIRACSRYLELERILNDPRHPDAAKDCDQMPEWPEYLEVARIVERTTPQTAAGIAALARVALFSSDGRDRDWNEGMELGIAYTLLTRLAEGAA